MRFFKINILFFLNVVFIYTHAQYSFKGTVKDDKTAETLTGVNIKVNNSKGAITDFNGQFSLDLAKGSHKIMISYVGYETKLIDVEIDKNMTTYITLSEELSELDVMVVSASKFEQKLEDVTVSVDVIGAKLIDSKNCVTLADVIRNAPGVQLIDGQLNIRAGSGWSYGTGSRVLVMVDDMPILSADQGEVEFNLIPMENIEQIEIIKGPSSTLYGTEAVAGVINILTKDPMDISNIELESFITSHLEKNIDFAYAPKMKKLDVLLSGNYFKLDNFLDDNKDNFTDIPFSERLSLFNQWNFKRVSQKKLSFSAKYYQENRSGGVKEWNENLRGNDSIYGESIYTDRIELVASYELPTDEDVRIMRLFKISILQT